VAGIALPGGLVVTGALPDGTQAHNRHSIASMPISRLASDSL
jgi:hypothetical protein